MTFSPRFLDEIRTRVGLAEVVGRTVRLSKKGREFQGLCPFHNEKTPSFTVNEDKGFYHCFGCGEHGSVFDFVMKTDNLSFPEAVELLAAEVGMMLADVAAQPDVVRVGNANEILAAKQSGQIGFMPTLEHLPIGNRLERVDQLHSQGVRLSGITYNRKNFIGDGMYERNPGGLSEFGIEVIHRRRRQFT